MINSLLVFSHLRWNFVFQRPQQLMQRLSRDWKIWFFEEPVRSPECFLERTSPAPNIVVCRPHTPIAATGFHDEQLPALQPLVDALVRDELREPYAVWMYSPMALPLTQSLRPELMVYDCMDELSAFRNAPIQLRQRESALLKRADLVFTGGPSLYRSKSVQHPNVHCFPSSVDAVHFGRVQEGGEDHPLQRALPRPRIGFYGVIDERIDLELVARSADARPDWQFVMVGPVAKIDEAALPRRENIHYFGQQPYEDLPAFIAGWDVCMQPFALNDSTRFISPTKTLEYMAAGRPIVSTPITDVAEPYSHVVHVASGAEDFVEACADALREQGPRRARREQDMRDIVAATSWERTAEGMRELMEHAAASKPAARVPQASDGATSEVLPSSRAKAAASGRRMREYGTIILGAGPTGLSAGYHLGHGSLLLEQNERVGGWCRSIERDGFTFDYAGHIMFSNDPYVQSLYGKLLGSNVHWQDREAWIYSKRTYTRYPFQGALYGLPPDVLKDCIVGAIEARFGPLNGVKAPDTAKPSSSIADCCADGILEATAAFETRKSSANDDTSAENFEQFIYRVWGKGIAKHFAIPYNRKLWSVPLSEMETSWLGGRVPLPDLEDMIDGALQPVPKPQGPNARFGYPLRGGFQALMDGFLPMMKCELATGARVARIDPVRHTLELADGQRYRYQHLISTAPLPELAKLLGDALPDRLRAAAARLRHVSVRCVHLGVRRPRVTDKHWIYYPEDTVFHRVFVQGNASPYCNPADGFGLTCEITYSPYKPLPCDGDALTERCIADCIEVGLLRPDDEVVVREQVDMPYAYVVYDHARAENVAALRKWTQQADITLAGRYAEWEYYNSDHAFIAGKRAAERALEALGSSPTAALSSA